MSATTDPDLASVSEAFAPVTEAEDPHCLSDEGADELLAGAPWRRFAVLGDSLVAGVGDPSPGYRSLSWPDRTANALCRQTPNGFAYVNFGQPRVRTRQVQSDQLGPALDLRPDLVALVCGGNDLLMRGFDPAVLETEVEGIVRPLAAQGAEIVLFTLMNATEAFPERAVLLPRLNALNDLMIQLAARYRGLLVDMWRHPAVGIRALYSADRTHPSMRGQAVLAAETIRGIAGFIPTAVARRAGTHDEKAERS